MIFAFVILLLGVLSLQAGAIEQETQPSSYQHKADTLDGFKVNATSQIYFEADQEKWRSLDLSKVSLSTEKQANEFSNEKQVDLFSVDIADSRILKPPINI